MYLPVSIIFPIYYFCAHLVKPIVSCYPRFRSKCYLLDGFDNSFQCYPDIIDGFMFISSGMSICLLKVGEHTLLVHSRVYQ